MNLVKRSASSASLRAVMSAERPQSTRHRWAGTGRWLRRRKGCRPCGGVGARIRVHQPEAVHGSLEDGAVALDALAQCLFGPLERGDVECIVQVQIIRDGNPVGIPGSSQSFDFYTLREPLGPQRGCKTPGAQRLGLRPGLEAGRPSRHPASSAERFMATISRVCGRMGSATHGRESRMIRFKRVCSSLSSSARLRAVMSHETPVMPTISPAGSRRRSTMNRPAASGRHLASRTGSPAP